MNSQHDDGWRLSDALWARMAPLTPRSKPHPLGCHRPRIPDRVAMDAILLVLRTGMQWGALDATGLCSHSSAHRRFREWTDAGVFERFWRDGLLACKALEKIDWGWLALDGTMTKAPLGGGKKSAPTRPTAAKGASSAACSMVTVCRWHWSSMAPTDTTAGCSNRRWRRSSSTSRQPHRVRGCAWIWAMSAAASMSMSGRSGWCRGFEVVGTSARPSVTEHGRGAGSSNARLAGSIVIDVC